MARQADGQDAVSDCAGGQPTSRLPKFVSADELSRRLLKDHGIPMTAERLRELAAMGYLPHHLIDGGGPYFLMNEAKEYIRRHLVKYRHPIPFPKDLKVIDPLAADRVASRVPEALVPMADHFQEMPLGRSVSSPCVYFLINEGVVVYVGQSVRLAGRIADHFRDKTFDRVLFITVPESLLLAVEGAFIAALRPRYNGGSDTRPRIDMDRFRDLTGGIIPG